MLYEGAFSPSVTTMSAWISLGRKEGNVPSRRRPVKVITYETITNIHDIIRARSESVRSRCDGSSDRSFMVDPLSYFSFQGVRYSSVVRAFAHDAMGRRIL